jgi:hypothetical protein
VKGYTTFCIQLVREFSLRDFPLKLLIRVFPKSWGMILRGILSPTTIFTEPLFSLMHRAEKFWEEEIRVRSPLQDAPFTFFICVFAEVKTFPEGGEDASSGEGGNIVGEGGCDIERISCKGKGEAFLR